MGRVTINGMVAQFSCKRTIPKELWNTKKKQTEGKRSYRKKSNTVRLCADDMLTREKLVAHHDSYAKAMAKYGLQRGVRGSEARHTTTAQYYRDLKKQTGKLEASVQQLQTEQRQAEQQLNEVKQEIKSEKLEAAKTEAKTALVANVGSLLGSGKLKELEADNHALQSKVTARDESIELLQQQIQRQQEEQPAVDGNASQAPQGNGGQGSRTSKKGVIFEIHHFKSTNMVSAVPRTSAHGEVLP